MNLEEYKKYFLHSKLLFKIIETFYRLMKIFPTIHEANAIYYDFKDKYLILEQFGKTLSFSLYEKNIMIITKRVRFGFLIEALFESFVLDLKNKLNISYCTCDMDTLILLGCQCSKRKK